MKTLEITPEVTSKESTNVGRQINVGISQGPWKLFASLFGNLRSIGDRPPESEFATYLREKELEILKNVSHLCKILHGKMISSLG